MLPCLCRHTSLILMIANQLEDFYIQVHCTEGNILPRAYLLEKPKGFHLIIIKNNYVYYVYIIYTVSSPLSGNLGNMECP